MDLIRTYIRLLFEQNDYRGEHTAPNKESGAPLYDLTKNGIYPEDIYSSNGLRLYGHHPLDGKIMGIIFSARNKPNYRVKIYRAVPYQPSIEERIHELEMQQKYILRTGKVPPKGDHNMDKSANYNANDIEIQRLKALVGKESSPKIPKINPGDWVTLARGYAAEHGRASLKNQYKIISKTVPAKQLFIDNDFQEWGWDP